MRPVLFFKTNNILMKNPKLEIYIYINITIIKDINFKISFYYFLY